MVRTFLLPIAQSAPLSLAILQTAAAAARSDKSLALRVVLAPDEPQFERALLHQMRASYPQLLPERGEFFVDLSKPKEIASAMETCDGVILSSSPSLSTGSPLLVEYEANMVHAASQAGLSHIIKVSCSQGLLGETSSVALGRAHWQIEQQIRSQRAAFKGDVAFVRPSTLMDTFLYGRMHNMVCGRTLSASVKTGRVAFVHPMDVAESVVKLLTANKTTGGDIGEYDLTGPEALTFAQVAESFSHSLGQRVRYSHYPLWAVQTALWIKGVRPDEIASEIAMANALESGAEAQVTDTVQALLGKAPRSFESFVNEHKREWPLKSYK